MNDTMNPDQIAALFEAAKPATMPETPRRPQPDAGSACARSTSRGRPSSQPTTSDGSPARWTHSASTAATRLTAELRASVSSSRRSTPRRSRGRRHRRSSRRTHWRSRSRSSRSAPGADDGRAAVRADARSSACSAAPPTSMPKERRFSEIDWSAQPPAASSRSCTSCRSSGRTSAGLSFAIDEI